MLSMRIGTLVVTVLYFPSYTIKSMAYGQFAVSTTLVVLYWIYFHLQFQKKALLLKNKKQHRDDPLLKLPFNSVRDFLPKRVDGQVKNDHAFCKLRIMYNDTPSSYSPRLSSDLIWPS